jgi:hypothetical protein
MHFSLHNSIWNCKVINAPLKRKMVATVYATVDTFCICVNARALAYLVSSFPVCLWLFIQHSAFKVEPVRVGLSQLWLYVYQRPLPYILCNEVQVRPVTVGV